MSNINLAGNIKKHRKAKGWTQQELATKASIPLSILAKIEQGFSNNPTIQTVLKIADALNITLNDLVERE